jgi:ribosomal protein S18 acetylase RimI-like enzyme
MKDVSAITGPLSLTFRAARREDLPAIVRLLADDHLGRAREDPSDPLPDDSVRAFEAIDRDPSIELIVAEREGAVIGCMQLGYLPGISHRGTKRLQIEAVRVATEARNQGIGRAMMDWAIERGRAQGCGIAQLTTNNERPEAHRFYARLGFEASHTGMKRKL